MQIKQHDNVKIIIYYIFLQPFISVVSCFLRCPLKTPALRSFLSRLPYPFSLAPAPPVSPHSDCVKIMWDFKTLNSKFILPDTFTILTHLQIYIKNRKQKRKASSQKRMSSFLYLAAVARGKMSPLTKTQTTIYTYTYFGHIIKKIWY